MIYNYPDNDEWLFATYLVLANERDCEYSPGYPVLLAISVFDLQSFTIIFFRILELFTFIDSEHPCY